MYQRAMGKVEASAMQTLPQIQQPVLMQHQGVGFQNLFLAFM